MGMFDSVMVKCPKCGVENEEQSKSGDCILKEYSQDKVPWDVAVGLLGVSECVVCDTKYTLSVPENIFVELQVKVYNPNALHDV